VPYKTSRRDGKITEGKMMEVVWGIAENCPQDSLAVRLFSSHNPPMISRVLLRSLGLGLWLITSCSRQPGPAGDTSELRVLCGSSMAAPAQAAAEIFKKAQGGGIALDLGGSETLLPRVLAGAAADIFICHDPFEQKVKDANHWAGVARVGQLRPVLLVRPGNPHHIRSVQDLTNTHLKIGIGDPRYSTCGELFVDLLKKQGLLEAVMPQVAMQGRAHAEIANGMIVGPLDVVVVWNYVAKLYQDKVELVRTDDPYPAIHVTVVGLTQSPQPKRRDAFLEWCRSDAARKLFEEHGYGTGARN
jgi:molybdate transport system substrate-binding protein